MLGPINYVVLIVAKLEHVILFNGPLDGMTRLDRKLFTVNNLQLRLRQKHLVLNAVKARVVVFIDSALCVQNIPHLPDRLLVSLFRCSYKIRKIDSTHLKQFLVVLRNIVTVCRHWDVLL